MEPVVASVGRDREHNFSKPPCGSIELVAGLGVAGDAHSGVDARHLTIVRKDPQRPNLRQVHLLHAELFEELAAQGHVVRPGDLGENVLTRGLDLLALPLGARLRIGAAAVVEITGLRNPCRQIDAFQPGLRAAVSPRAADGTMIRKAGVMSVVIMGGEIRPGDAIRVEAPAGEPKPLPVL